MKQLTILIPCYNGEKLLKRCLDSCINQTYKDFEIVIVNDGSTDNSQNIINEYTDKYSNIKCIQQSNKGLASARNVLLNHLNTQYGYFLDVDDWIEPYCVEDLISANDKDYDLIINASFIDKNNKFKPYYISNKINKNTNNEKYLIKNTPFAWGIMFKKQYLIDYEFSFCEQSQFFEDAGIMSYLIYKTNHIKFLNKPAYHYCIYNNSLSRKINANKVESALIQLNNFYELLKQEKFVNNKLPKAINDQLVLYHCIIFTYIQFQSSLNKKQKYTYKQQLKDLERNNYKLRFPSRYWKFWYFVLYKLYMM